MLTDLPRVARCIAVVGFASAVAGAAIIEVPEDQPTIADAIAVAADGDIIRVQAGVFDGEPFIDLNGKALTIQSVGGLHQPVEGLYLLATDAELVALQGDLQLHGHVRSSTGGSASLVGDNVQISGSGRLSILPNALLLLSVPGYVQSDGTVVVRQSGTLWWATPLTGSSHLGGSTSLEVGATFLVDGDLQAGGTLSATEADISVSNGLQMDGAWTFAGGALLVHDDLWVYGLASLQLLPGTLTVLGDCTNYGTLRSIGGALTAGSMSNYSTGPAQGLYLVDATVYCGGLFNASSAYFSGSGTWFADLQNDGTIVLIGDTTLTGDTVNNGTINIQDGVLTLYGSLVNNGTIIGNWDPPLERDDRMAEQPLGLRVAGDYTGGVEAGLTIADHTLRVDGDFDAAIADHLSFDLARGTLRVGAPGASTTLEVLSTDIGPSPAGLDRLLPGHYPLGTLLIAAGVVSLQDIHDNDGQGQGQCEALYVDVLRIAEGATLNAGCHIYYNVLENAGAVSDPTALVRILPWQRGDMNCDGSVGFGDINPFVQYVTNCVAWQAAHAGCPTEVGDIDGDGLHACNGNLFDDINAFVALLAGG